MINESNYHKYLDDFVNGLLDEELEMEFVAFLDRHPGILDSEMLSEGQAALDDSFKASLKRELPLDTQHADEWFIAEMEGDLNEGQEKELQNWMKLHPELETSRSLIQQSKLDASEVFIYPYKSDLRRRPAIFLYTRWTSGIAAALLLGWIIFRVWNPMLPQTEEAGLVPVIPQENAIELPVSIPNPEIEKQERKVETIRVGAKPQQEVPELILAETKTDIDLKKIQTKDIRIKGQVNPVFYLEKPVFPVQTRSINEFATSTKAPEEQTLIQWAYKKVRKRVVGEERIVPEKEIPEDMVQLVMENFAPVFQYKSEERVTTIRIAGVEINRRSGK
ncbi:MAG: hypothetical protein LPK45_10155 [Bacteroidota bacterium]|nr:hypothetical protein [Bacteroidota bacterium]MDX5431455.1 hypothetical protein [Bacteroidota bacterium]MDX5470183.1 hypothetical protein [Bacteroidota bacterium]